MSCGRLKLSKEEEKELRTLILSMVDEPLVRVIKLADRPHNMRTLYALKPAKQRAIWYRIWSPNWGEGRGDVLRPPRWGHASSLFQAAHSCV